MITNRNGYELLEYISCSEAELNKYENITGAGVIFEVDNKYLVGFNNWRLQWEIPAGGIDQGETPKQAALRELKEEAHQEIDDAEFVGLFKKKRPTGKIVYMAIYKYTTDSIRLSWDYSYCDESGYRPSGHYQTLWRISSPKESAIESR